MIEIRGRRSEYGVVRGAQQGNRARIKKGGVVRAEKGRRMRMARRERKEKDSSKIKYSGRKDYKKRHEENGIKYKNIK